MYSSVELFKFRLGKALIVSHRHRFIFFAVPRTGTHSVRTALRPHLGEGDWEQEGLRRKVTLPVPALARIGHGHISLKQAQVHLREEVWGAYFKFAFVRDPYDRFVSSWTFMNTHNPPYGDKEAAFMKKALSTEGFRHRVLVRPQVELLEDELGALGMDFIGRYESLAASFAEVCRRIGLPPQPLAHSNASTRRGFSHYYDDELLGMVTDFYRSDFERLGYETAAGPKAGRP